MTESNLEKIKKVCFQKGATDALNDLRDIIIKLFPYINDSEILKETHKDISDLYSKYKAYNIISGDELDRAEEMSE